MSEETLQLMLNIMNKRLDDIYRFLEAQHKQQEQQMQSLIAQVSELVKWKSYVNGMIKLLLILFSGLGALLILKIF